MKFKFLPLITVIGLIAIFNQNTIAQRLTDLANDTTLNYNVIKKKVRENKGYLENASEKEKKMYYRWDAFWMTRVDKHGSMKEADKAMAKYLKEIETDPKNQKAAAINTWEPRGPWNYGLDSEGRIGRVQAVWANPANVSTILIGTHGNGIWKTTNGGKNWTRLNPNIPGGVSSIAVDPNNKSKIYITTGVRESGFERKNYCTGIYGSQDGGTTWVRWDLGNALTYAHSILIDKFNSRFVYALTENGVYKIDEIHLSFTKILTAKTGQIFYELKQHPNTAGVFYVAGNNSFYYTTTSGNIWNDGSDNIEEYGDWRFSVDCSEDNILYGFTYKYNGINSPYSRLCKSNPTTINWTKFVVSNPYCDQFIGHTVRALKNGNVYVGAVTGALFKYNGTGFTYFGFRNHHLDIRSICFPKGDASLIYLATDGGISKDTIGSDPNYIYFTQINGNLALNECYDVAINENDAIWLLVECTIMVQ